MSRERRIYSACTMALGVAVALMGASNASAQHARPVAAQLRRAPSFGTAPAPSVTADSVRDVEQPSFESFARTTPPPLTSLGVPNRTRVGALRDPIAPWWAPVASGLLPGTGQLFLRQPRSVVYLATEMFLVLQYLNAGREHNEQRTSYRQIAADVARAPFGGTRPTGQWEYYEAMEKKLESGRYDMVPGGELDPETDESTYNGERWLLARETYWLRPDSAPAKSSSAYQLALAEYQRRAAHDDYRWSWRDAQLEQDLYVQAVSGANRSKQRATTLRGRIALTHLVSLVDAYISVRARRYGGVRVGALTITGAETAVVQGLTPDQDRVEVRIRSLIPGQGQGRR